MLPERKRISRIILTKLAPMKSRSLSMLMIGLFQGDVYLLTRNYLLPAAGVEYAKSGVYQIVN